MSAASFLRPPFVFAGVGIFSTLALFSAFYAEAFLGLEPCVLCIYQRYPFAFGALLGLIGLSMRKKQGATVLLLCALSLNFLVNSGIAFYHTGVELHWWQSEVSGCAVPVFEDNSQKSILENIMSAPLGDCSKISWADPVLGLSMANYNVFFGFGLFLICGISALLHRAKKNE